MKKILYVSDALNIDLKNLDFAGYISALTRSKLTAIFLENDDVEVRTDKMIRESAVNAGLNVTEETDVLKRHCIDTNIQQFRTACETRGIQNAVHRDRGNPLDEMILESRYADLALLNVETAFTRIRQDIPTDFVENVLTAAECPVIVMPETFDRIGELVFTYDGKSSSIYAIKQFTYLFPQLSDVKVVVISINAEEVDPEERYKFREWLHANYSNVDFLSTEGNVKVGLLEILLSRNNAFIVMGAYGRSTISTLFRPSHAENILKMTSQAVFIAHC